MTTTAPQLHHARGFSRWSAREVVGDAVRHGVATGPDSFPLVLRLSKGLCVLRRLVLIQEDAEDLHLVVAPVDDPHSSHGTTIGADRAATQQVRGKSPGLWVPR